MTQVLHRPKIIRLDPLSSPKINELNCFVQIYSNVLRDKKGNLIKIDKNITVTIKDECHQENHNFNLRCLKTIAQNLSPTLPYEVPFSAAPSDSGHYSVLEYKFLSLFHTNHLLQAPKAGGWHGFIF